MRDFRQAQAAREAIQPGRSILSGAGGTRRALAILDVVQKHLELSALRHGLGRVAAEATADGIGDDPKALAELVDEAKGEVAVANRRSDEEDPGNLCGLVLVRQQSRTAKAPLGLV